MTELTSRLAASIATGIDEEELERIINGRSQPTASQREILASLYAAYQLALQTVNAKMLRRRIPFLTSCNKIAVQK